MSQMLPWMSLVAIIWLQAMSGTNTDFPAYSSKLKIRLHMTQVQLNNLAVASDSGKLFGFLSGIAASFLPLSSVLVIGSIIGFIGYGVQFLFLTHKISHLAYWQYLILQVLAGHSVCWINTACYVSSMRKFPKHHGIVVGLATSYTGLSAKIYIALAKVVLGNNFTSDNVYLILNASVPLMLAVLTAPLLVEGKPMRDSNGKGLIVLFVIAAVTGVYTVMETLVPVMEESCLPYVMLLVMILILVLVPVWAGLKSVLSERMRVAAVDLEASVTGDNGVENAVKDGKKCETGSEHGVWKLITCMDFWVYFLVYLFGGTMGLVYANNLGQVANSRGGERGSSVVCFLYFRILWEAVSSSFVLVHQVRYHACISCLDRSLFRLCVSLFRKSSELQTSQSCISFHCSRPGTRPTYTNATTSQRHHPSSC